MKGDLPTGLDWQAATFFSITNALISFRQLDPNFPLAGMLALLHTGLTEFNPQSGKPLSVTDLAKSAEVDRQTMARIVRYLGDGDDRIGGNLRKGIDGGLRMVQTFPDLEDRRIKRVRLTDQGRAFVSNVMGMPLTSSRNPRSSLQIKRNV